MNAEDKADRASRVWVQLEGDYRECSSGFRADLGSAGFAWQRVMIKSNWWEIEIPATMPFGYAKSRLGTMNGVCRVSRSASEFQ
jgi:hypothetical protein